MARSLDWLGWLLVMVGALNWGLIALAELDLIAALTGRSFGETNVLSRTIYVLIGLSGVWMAVRPLFERRAATPQATRTTGTRPRGDAWPRTSQGRLAGEV